MNKSNPVPGNKSAIRHLKDLYLLGSEQKHPSIPAYARFAPNYTDKTANGLTRCIIDFINLSGGQAERINNTGRQIDSRQTVQDVLGHTRTIGSIKWIKGTGTNGTADISATIKGRSVKVEVKIGKDKQSDFQIKYQFNIERAGGIYFVAKDFESFLNWYKLKFSSDENR